MIFKTNCEIVGAKMFEGNIEGVAYDSTTLFVKTELDESRDTARGFATTEYKYGTSAEFARIKDRKFPFLAECEIELTTTGRKDSKRMISMHPLARPVAPGGGAVGGAVGGAGVVAGPAK